MYLDFYAVMEMVIVMVYGDGSGNSNSNSAGAAKIPPAAAPIPSTCSLS